MDGEPGAARRLRGIGWRGCVSLWRLYAYLDLVWIARDFRSAIGYYLSDAVAGVGAVLGTLLLAERFTGLGGWTRGQVIFMLGYGVLASGVLDLFFNYNVKFISRRLGRGQLDHTLVQPHPVWMTFLTEGFAPFSGSPMLLPGIALLVWSATHGGASGDAGLVDRLRREPRRLGGDRPCVLVPVGQPRVLGSPSGRGDQHVGDADDRPAEGLPARRPRRRRAGGPADRDPRGARRLAPEPSARLASRAPNPLALWLTPIAAVAISAAAALAFRAGLAEYRRTGSRRYSDFGHRR